jgi:hypothetical protein
MDDLFAEEGVDLFHHADSKDKDLAANEMGMLEEQRKQSQAGLDLLKKRMGLLQQTIYKRRSFLKSMQGRTDSDTPCQQACDLCCARADCHFSGNEARQDDELALLALASSTASKKAQ